MVLLLLLLRVCRRNGTGRRRSGIFGTVLIHLTSEIRVCVTLVEIQHFNHSKPVLHLILEEKWWILPRLIQFVSIQSLDDRVDLIYVEYKSGTTRRQHHHKFKSTNKKLIQLATQINWNKLPVRLSTHHAPPKITTICEWRVDPRDFLVGGVH